VQDSAAISTVAPDAASIPALKALSNSWPEDRRYRPNEDSGLSTRCAVFERPSGDENRSALKKREELQCGLS
jgi:hypothetical protein